MLAVCVPIVLALLISAGAVARDLMIGPRFDDPWLLGGAAEFNCQAGIDAILAELPGEFEAGESDAEDACHGASLLSDDGNGTGEWTFRIAVERSDYDNGYAEKHDLEENARECELLLPSTGATTKYSSDFGPYCVWRNPDFSTDEERSFSEVGLVRSGDEVRISVIVQSPPQEQEGWISPAMRLDMLEYLEDRAAMVYAEQLDPDGTVPGQLEEAHGDPDAHRQDETGAVDWCAVTEAVGAVFREREADFLDDTEIAEYAPGASWSDRFDTDSDCYRAWKILYTYGTAPAASQERFDVAVSVHLEPWVWGESGLAAERSEASEIFEAPVEAASSSLQVFATELDGSSFELSFLVDSMHVVRIVCAGQTHFGSEFIAEDVAVRIWSEAERLIAESNR